MAGFSITSPTTTVLLRRARDGTAVGEAQFTVANQTGHAVRARVTAVPEGSTDPSWLEVDDQERNFQAGATEPFVLAIKVGPTVGAGDYTFRVDAASVTLPDEEWGRGNSVQFHIPEVAGPPPEKPEEAGYIETVGGALIGGFVVAVILLGVGLVVGLGAASGTGTGGTGGGGIGDAIGNAIASGIAFVIVLLFIGLAFAGLGSWLGPPIGAFLALRFRGFPDPWLTALPMVLLMPLLGLPITIALLSLSSAIGMSGAVGLIWGVLTGIIAVSAPALAARAFARWRQTGHL